MSLAALHSGLETLSRWQGLLTDCHESQRDHLRLLLSERYTASIQARRQGKTEAVLRFICYHALTTPDYRAAWIEDYPQAAWETIRPILDALAQRYGFELNPLSTHHTMRIGDGGIRCYGVRHERFVSLVRGKQYDLVHLDEAQRLYDVDLASAIHGPIVHTLSDRRGTLSLSGTPGDVDMGLFFRIVDHYGKVVSSMSYEDDPFVSAQEKETAKWFSLHEGTPFGNPHVADQQREQLDQWRTHNPDIEAEPWVQREMFGRWVTDPRGRIVELTERNYLTDWKPEPDDQYLLGIDYGYHPDPSAFVVATFNQRRYPWLIYLEGETAGQLLDDELAAYVAEYRRRYPAIARVDMDPGGGGKSTASHLNRVHGAGVSPAIKVDKRAAISALKSQVSLGNIKIYNAANPENPRENAVAKQWNKLQWLRTKHGLEEGKPRHIHDAALYVFRASQHYLYQEPKPVPSNKKRRIAMAERRNRKAYWEAV